MSADETADIPQPVSGFHHLIGQVGCLSFPASFRNVAMILVALIASIPAIAEGTSTPSPQVTAASSIVIGFVGGFVRHDNPRHGPVQLAQRLRHAAPKDTYVQVFENRHRKLARAAILRLLDTNHDGTLSEDEKTRAHILLFGHSWGAAATVLLARDLQRDGIPVELTVQVDSVAKPGQNDSVIPANVVEAENFYQPHGLVHGQKRIVASDPMRTQILGNNLVDYRKEPAHCVAGGSWFDHLTPSHAQSECDPKIWSQVEELIRRHLTPQPNTAAMQIVP